jgi:hypothetical protein
MTFAIAVPDATPVFTDWLAECKRQVTEEISKAGSVAKILLMVGGLAADIEYLVGAGWFYGGCMVLWNLIV